MGLVEEVVLDGGWLVSGCRGRKGLDAAWTYERGILYRMLKRFWGYKEILMGNM